MKYFRIYSKVNQIIYSLSSNSPSFKVLAPNTLKYFANKVNTSKVTKGRNSKCCSKFTQVDQVVYSLLPVYSSSFKALVSIVLRFSWQDCVHSFQRAKTLERGIILSRQKYVSAIFSWGIHMRNFKAIVSTLLKLRYASKAWQTDGRTPPEATCTTNFDVGGIKN